MCGGLTGQTRRACRKSRYNDSHNLEKRLHRLGGFSDGANAVVFKIWAIIAFYLR